MLARGADQGFRHSIDRASLELLYVPLAADLRVRIKSFLDMVVSRSADGLASLVLLALIALTGHQIGHVSWAASSSSACGSRLSGGFAWNT